MKQFLLTILFTFVLVNASKAQQVTHIVHANEYLQRQVNSILSHNIKGLNAINGQVIIMDCKSGEIKAMVNLMNTKSGIKPAIRQLSEPTALMRTVSLLAALEQGKVKPNDSIDTKEGMIDISGYLLEDYNWRRGGNGKTSVQQGFLLSSNIATYLAVKQAFGKEYAQFHKIITDMGYGLPQDSIKAALPIPNDNITLAKFATGKNQQISPLQILTFYNAIVNNGKMVKPTFHKRDTTIIKEQLASKENIAIIQQLLVQKVKDGLAHQAYSNKVSIAGEQGAVAAKDNRANKIYCLQFCGYYPSDNPQYSIIVSLNKKGLPASGGMAGEITKQIVETNNFF
ncbi:penicillin-binding transpeptidase domain-containing protein [Prevotella pallens]|jgi:penicillin-binding protein, transpeptidase domain protein|uniref:penicillin-binding transpeptidase domain-containing protein n=1 Tax=Prevotella pallens TaxID=60133 RepID=UPI001CAB4CD4|nr:penicillin-binding transpeptidase domain-containing protein [Prevotella pallens]MBF1443874.1 penicillin-binding protein [Prevotella pallens]MBF1459631.1 penicillin-binding protein [Prevotella pallens]MBF1490444.1 penicillin-binding protein [Prevotella pallens]